MTANELFAWMEGMNPSPYTAEQKTLWLNDLEAALWTEVFLQPAGLWKGRTEAEGDRHLLLPENRRMLYAMYLWAMMDFARGEHGNYANSMALYNDHLAQLQCWYAENYAPAMNPAVWSEWATCTFDGTGEPRCVMAIPAGYAVLGAECRITAAGDLESVSLGTEEEAEGYMPAGVIDLGKTGPSRSFRFTEPYDRAVYAHGQGTGTVRFRLLLQPDARSKAMPTAVSPAAVYTVSGGTGQAGTDGEDGGYYVPAVTQVDEYTAKVSFTPSKDGMAEAADQTIALPPGADGADGLVYVPSVDSDGYLRFEPQSSALPVPLVKIKHKVYVTDYGAAGDGTTDDTTAFQTALAECRTVYVPGGTYILSGTLVIAENCELELSQDAILQFTQTTGNCIEMRGSATLRGNHAVISVPYAFAGNAISMDTTRDGTDHLTSIPPYTQSDPMFKRQRFVYDVNIIKPNPQGYNRSTDGTCSGTAIYMSADGTASITWMWAILLGGVRIAGGFAYGIRAANFDDPDRYADNAWNHDMRIEAVIEACEVGVSLENCNGAHLNVTVQPCQARDGTAYAKWGVYLNDSRFVDMMRSRVWDWNASNSLWTDGGEYQHLAMIGNCRGLLLDDFLYYETSYDIRDLIYTDTAGNLEQLTILQEPFTRWFKPVDNAPYFFNGTENKELMLKEDKIDPEQTSFIHSSGGEFVTTPNFTDLVDDEVGYSDGYYLNAGGELSANTGYTTSGFIPIDGGSSHVYRIAGEGITWNDSYGYCRIAWYDSNKLLKGSVMAWDKIGLNEYYPTAVEDDAVAAAFATNANVAAPSGAAYFRVTAAGSGVNLVITIDEKVDYTTAWEGEPTRLDESVFAQNVVLTSSGGSLYKLVVSDDGTLSAEAYE